MQRTPKALRLHIAIFGRRNVGKSSILNALTHQQVSIVSDVAGTTTDPVEKTMELKPVGPVVFVDTAGIDDEGALGKLRVGKTRQVFDRTDVALLVTEPGPWTNYEKAVIEQLRKFDIPVIVVINKTDISPPPEKQLDEIRACGLNPVPVCALSGEGMDKLREQLVQHTPEGYFDSRRIIADIIEPNALVVLVVPIDLEAPKGRLIVPQVQTIRDILDADASCIVVKETGLKQALARLREPPALVVTDSQGFESVARDTPDEVPLTSFSILFARFKGDLPELVRGVTAIDSLKPGDRVVIGEACTHHPVEDDIGRVKIPRWINRRVGGGVKFEVFAGRDFPEDLSPYKLIIHCGACMWNRRAMLTRIMKAREAGVPITNYGLVIAYLHNILPRALRGINAAGGDVV